MFLCFNQNWLILSFKSFSGETEQSPPQTKAQTSLQNSSLLHLPIRLSAPVTFELDNITPILSF